MVIGRCSVSPSSQRVVYSQSQDGVTFPSALLSITQPHSAILSLIEVESSWSPCTWSNVPLGHIEGFMHGHIWRRLPRIDDENLWPNAEERVGPPVLIPRLSISDALSNLLVSHRYGQGTLWCLYTHAQGFQLTPVDSTVNPLKERAILDTQRNCSSRLLTPVWTYLRQYWTLWALTCPLESWGMTQIFCLNKLFSGRTMIEYEGGCAENGAQTELLHGSYFQEDINHCSTPGIMAERPLLCESLQDSN